MNGFSDACFHNILDAFVYSLGRVIYVQEKALALRYLTS